MKQIDLEIVDVKNIKKLASCFPLEKGLYALVGENACGKSTIMLALSLIVKTSSSRMLRAYDISPDSRIKIHIDGADDLWFYKNGKMTTGKYGPVRGYGLLKPRNALVASTHMDGFYEGSIFYGCRFDDYNTIDQFIAKPNVSELLTEADDFVKETLGYILHNNRKYYASLKKIITHSIARQEGFNGIPYFIEINGNIISQYRMSSGESMLISLIDFINNLVIKSLRKSRKILFLILTIQSSHNE